jgi:hypothetical protein
MARKPLRAATEADAQAEVEKAAKPKTLIEAIESGTYLEVLVAQRRQMADDVKSTTGPALAALHRQIATHSKEIAALQVAEAEEAAENAEAADDEPFGADAI